MGLHRPKDGLFCNPKNQDQNSRQKGPTGFEDSGNSVSSCAVKPPTIPRIRRSQVAAQAGLQRLLNNQVSKQQALTNYKVCCLFCFSRQFFNFPSGIDCYLSKLLGNWCHSRCGIG